MSDKPEQNAATDAQGGAVAAARVEEPSSPSPAASAAPAADRAAARPATAPNATLMIGQAFVPPTKPTPAPITPSAAVRGTTPPPVAADLAALGSGVLANLDSAVADPYLGTVVADRYRIERKLGEGGMGSVYLAEHVIIEKKVALKILSEDFARKPEQVQRFLQEAKAASRIGQENIVDINDFGATPSGSVFIAMELLEGKDLATHLQLEGAMPFERARYIVGQICRGLGAAHAKGIVHRDMKPENVYLVEREGRGDFVKILDFGIAKVSSLDEAGSRLTRTGMIFGTPEYMSPEQARGEKPDQRVDVYAVGCMLYEMLTGEVPFSADSFMGVLTKHMFEEPQPPSLRAPERGIPQDAEAVVLKALTKDREQRYQTMQALADALAACGGDGVVMGGATGLSGAVMASGGVRVATTTVPAVAAANGRGAGWKLGVAAGVVVCAAIGLGVARHRSATQAQAQAATQTVAQAQAQAATQTVVQAQTVTQATSPTNTAPAVADTKADPPPPTHEPAPPAEAPPVEAPPKPTVAALHLTSNPSEAEVVRDDAVLGLTPLDFKLPLGDQPVTLTLRHAGYREREIQVVPSEDRAYDFELAALPKPKRTPKRTLKHSSRPTKAHAQPAGHSTRIKDLKDPFGN